jgi:hypothetical protein
MHHVVSIHEVEMGNKNNAVNPIHFIPIKFSDSDNDSRGLDGLLLLPAQRLARLVVEHCRCVIVIVVVCVFTKRSGGGGGVLDGALGRQFQASRNRSDRTASLMMDEPAPKSHLIYHDTKPSSSSHTTHGAAASTEPPEPNQKKTHKHTHSPLTRRLVVLVLVGEGGGLHARRQQRQQHQGQQRGAQQEQAVAAAAGGGGEGGGGHGLLVLFGCWVGE